MSLIAHAEQVRGLTRVFDSLAVSAAGAAARLAEMTGQSHGDALTATILNNFFTRNEAGRVGTMNATEAEIERRQVTRTGAEAGLVGNFFAPFGAGLVGNLSPVYAEISRRLFFRDDRAAVASQVDADLVAIYLQFFTRFVLNT